MHEEDLDHAEVYRGAKWTKPGMRILSYGAGVQSTALLVAADRGLIPPVDLAVFADVGAEPTQVYQWLEFVRARVSIPISVVKGGNLEQDILTNPRFSSAPFYVTSRDPNGRGGMLKRQCTADYKIRPIRRHLAQYKDRGPLTVLMGISTDEIGRAKESGLKWLRHEFPLLWSELGVHCGGILGWDRAKCISYVEQELGARPPKSACYFCPFHDKATWARMKREDPETWKRAVAFDEGIRNIRRDVLDGQLFVHKSFKPLAEVNMDREENDPNQMTFADECDGMCGV